MSLGDRDASRAKAENGASFTVPLSVNPEFPEVYCELRTRVGSLAIEIARNDGLRSVARVAGKIRGKPSPLLRAARQRVPQRRSAEARDRDLPRAAPADAWPHEWPDRVRPGALRGRRVRRGTPGIRAGSDSGPRESHRARTLGDMSLQRGNTAEARKW